MQRFEYGPVTVFRGGEPSDHLYLHHGFFANSSVIISNGSSAVIDTPMLGHLAQPILDAITGTRLDYVINTHGHLDHHLTNCLFSPGEIVQTGSTNAYLNGFEDYIGYYLGLAEYQPVADALRALRLVSATRIIKGDTTLPLDGMTLELHCVGTGETTDNLVVFLPEERVLFTGDLVYHQVHPFVGDLNKISDWINALRELRVFGAVLYIPGHGLPYVGETGLDQQIAYLEHFADQFTRWYHPGVSAEELKHHFILKPFDSYAMKESFFEFSIECLVSGYPASTMEQVG